MGGGEVAAAVEDIKQGEEVYGRVAVPSGCSGSFAEMAVAKALDYVKEVHSMGKVVLTMGQQCNKQQKPASSYRMPPPLFLLLESLRM